MNDAKGRGDARRLGASLGLALRRDRGGPCPECGAARTSAKDRRPPVRMEGSRWWCNACGERGSVLDLAALLATGRPFDARDSDQVEVVRSLCAREGWCTGPAVRVELPERRPAPPPLPTAEPAPRGEIEALWSACGRPVDGSPEVAWLVSRGFNPAAVVALDLARTLPPRELPGWAAHWRRFGVRLALPLYDSRGELAGLHGRTLAGSPKSVRMAGVRCSGLTFANAEALEVLAGGRIRGDALICEGGPDFLTASLVARGAAVLGIPGSGGWSEGHGRALNRCSGATIATHQDTAGHRYSEKVASTLEVRHRRAVWREGRDLNDILQAKGAAGVTLALYQAEIPRRRRRIAGCV